MAASYRPCAVCLPEEYDAWKAERQERRRVSEERRSLDV